MFQSGLVRRIPHIHETYTGMESVEHYERKADVPQDSPGDLAVKLVSLVETFRGFVGESVEDPHANIGNDEEHEELAAWLLTAQLPAVAASPQAVDKQSCLKHHLDHLKRSVTVPLKSQYLLCHRSSLYTSRCWALASS